MLWWEALVLIAGTATLSVLWNIQRSHKKWSGELVPNCLLTRFPLVFIPGPRSVFFFKKYYFLAPSYLAEHGYDVFELHLPWRKNRSEALGKYLQSFRHQKKAIHIVLHPQVYEELKETFNKYPDVILSTTHYKSEKPHFSMMPLNHLHNLLTPYEISFSELGASQKDFPSLIDKVQKIAEDDFTRGTS